MNSIPSLKKKGLIAEYTLEEKIQNFYRGMLLYPLKKIPNLPEIASEMNVSVSKFQKSFKDIYGCSHYQAYMNIRFDFAIHLLRTEQYRVFEVAEILGYCQPAKFVLQFRERYGISPKKYANTNKG